MKRYRGPAVAALVVLVAVLVFRLGRRPVPEAPAAPPDPGAEPTFVEPGVTEFTPAGWAKFRADVTVALEQSSFFRGTDPALELWVRQAQKRGRYLDAYQAVGPAVRGKAFRGLVWYLVWIDDPNDTFARLVEARRRDDPADPWITFHTAERHARRREYATAEPLYAAAAAADPGERQFRRGWSDCLLNLGRWRDAYDTAGPGRDTFLRVAGHLLSEGDAAALQGLVESHRTVDPAETELMHYRGWACRLRGEYAAADRNWAEYLTTEGVQRFLPAEINRQFRNAVWRDRIADARAFVEHPPRAADPADVPVWRAILAARAGDPAGVARALGELRAAAPAFAWYHDADLAALLETDAMAEVRRRFPKPD